jgi:hypothetical protein
MGESSSLDADATAISDDSRYVCIPKPTRDLSLDWEDIGRAPLRKPAPTAQVLTATISRRRQCDARARVGARRPFARVEWTRNRFRMQKTPVSAQRAGRSLPRIITR